MTKGSIWLTYKSMRPEEQRFFNRWLTANFALSSIFIVGFIAMAVVGGPAPQEDLQVSAAAKPNLQYQPFQVPTELLTPVSEKR
jgi:hypothetical protein